MGSQRENYIAVGCTFQRHTFFPRNSSIILSVPKRRNSFFTTIITKEGEFQLGFLAFANKGILYRMTLKPMACVLETQEWVQSREKEILLQTFFAFGHVREQPRFFIQMILELYCKRHKKVLP